jgi:3-deoxy-manno-octulosonate cytidylyltransferase (CMP-KDO synthetase)
MSKARVIGIIPARLGSKRLPGKPLKLIHGKPLIQNVYENVAKSKLLDRLIVVTDSPRISDRVFAFGGEALVSLKKHPTGRDRVAEAARNLNYDLVINIQCDSIYLPPGLIDSLISSLLKERSVLVGTLATRITDPDRFSDPHVVKVALDKKDFAVYFSRYPIPYIRGYSRPGGGTINPSLLKRISFWEHIGIYGFRKDFLMKFASWKQTPLEKLEKLEQLRVLENGYKIKVYLTKHKIKTIDGPEDLKKIKSPKGGVVR